MLCYKLAGLFCGTKEDLELFSEQFAAALYVFRHIFFRKFRNQSENCNYFEVYCGGTRGSLRTIFGLVFTLIKGQNQAFWHPSRQNSVQTLNESDILFIH